MTEILIHRYEVVDRVRTEPVRVLNEAIVEAILDLVDMSRLPTVLTIDHPDYSQTVYTIKERKL